MNERFEPSWSAEFTTEDLGAIRQAIPHAIHNSQERSARAHTAWDDPDGDQDVYGAGMSRGVQKEFQGLLKGLPTYREDHVSGTRRTLTYVGDTLLFMHRVGKRMPRNNRRVRLTYLPESRRELLGNASNVKYSEPSLFDLAPTQDDDPATLTDVLDVASRSSRPITLFVPYYSSTPTGIGSMFWGPARLNGRHLEFTEPEQLTYRESPATGGAERAAIRVTGGFADGDRPRTATRLRSHSVDPQRHETS